MDKVLIAVDGEEESGRATAYLIDRITKSGEAEFVIVTVYASDDQKVPEHSWAHLRKRRTVSVEDARPWLDYAGLAYEFSKKTGDIASIINSYLSGDDFAEVVLISQRLDRSRGTGSLLGFAQARMLSKIRKPSCTKLTVLTQPPEKLRH